MDSWPLQLMVVALADGVLSAGLIGQLRASRASGVIQLVDGGIVRKGDEGELSMRSAPELELDDDPRNGKLAGLLFSSDAAGSTIDVNAETMCRTASEEHLFGLSADDLAEIADGIPRASDALVLLIEHRWTAGFAESVEVEKGTLLAIGDVVPNTVLQLSPLPGSRHEPT